MTWCVGAETVYLGWNVSGHTMEMGRYVWTGRAAALGSRVKGHGTVLPAVVSANSSVLHHCGRVRLLYRLQEGLGDKREVAGACNSPP